MKSMWYAEVLKTANQSNNGKDGVEEYLDKYFGVSIKEQWRRHNNLGIKWLILAIVSFFIALLFLFTENVFVNTIYVMYMIAATIFGLYVMVESLASFYIHKRIEKHGSSPQEIKMLLTEYRGLLYPEIYKYYRNLYRQWIIEDIKQMLDL